MSLWADAGRIAECERLVNVGIDLWHNAAVLRSLQRRRRAWLDAQGDNECLDQWRIYRRSAAILEALEADWQRVARAARINALRLDDDGRQQLLAFGLDYGQTTADNDDALRQQWRNIVATIPEEPCPF